MFDVEWPAPSSVAPSPPRPIHFTRTPPPRADDVGAYHTISLALMIAWLSLPDRGTNLVLKDSLRVIFVSPVYPVEDGMTPPNSMLPRKQSYAPTSSALGGGGPGEVDWSGRTGCDRGRGGPLNVKHGSTRPLFLPPTTGFFSTNPPLGGTQRQKRKGWGM